jgi:hypothetical protein
MTLSIKGLYVTLTTNTQQIALLYAVCHYAQCRIFYCYIVMLSFIMLGVVMPNVVVLKVVAPPIRLRLKPF